MLKVRMSIYSAHKKINIFLPVVVGGLSFVKLVHSNECNFFKTHF